MIIVMRKPVFAEDEGRHFHTGTYNTREEAQAWVDAQTDEYYKPSDYYVMDSER